MLESIILIASLISGQLIKLPFANFGGLILLDFAIFLIILIGILKIRFKRPNPLIFSGLFFCLICFISLIFTPLSLTNQQYLVSFFYTLRVLGFIILLYLLFSNSLKFSRQIPKILIFSGLILSVLGILQFLFLPDLRFLETDRWDPHYFRAVSTFLDPNFFGAFLVLTLLTLLQNNIFKNKKIFFISLLTIYIALLLTFSRSSYLFFLVGLLSFSFLIKSVKHIFLTTVFFGILMFGFFLYTQFISTPRNINREGSASLRINTWQQGLEIFQRNPILGVGFNSYRFGIDQYELGDNQFLSSRGSSANDSSLLFVLSTTGVIGLLSYCFFLFQLIKLGLTKNLSLVAGVVGLLVHSFFANSLFYPPILLWIILQSAFSFLTPKK